MWKRLASKEMSGHKYGHSPWSMGRRKTNGKDGALEHISMIFSLVISGEKESHIARPAILSFSISENFCGTLRNV